MVLQSLLFALKGIAKNMKKNLMILPVSYFFQNMGHNLTQILPQDHTRLDFFLVSNELCSAHKITYNMATENKGNCITHYQQQQ